MLATEKVFDMYGVQGLDLCAAAQIVELAFGVPLLPHESDYMGGDYFRAEYNGGVVTVQHNYLEPMKSWSEPEYQGFSLILRVNNASEPDVIRECLERCGGGRIVWLERNIVEGRKLKVLRRAPT